MFVFRSNGSQTTSTQIPVTKTLIPTVVVIPTETQKATSVPPTALPKPTDKPTVAPPTSTQAPKILSSDSEFVLDNISLKVYGVTYSLINGGQSRVGIITRPDQVYFLVTLYSNEKDLGSIYKNYGKTIALIYPDTNTSYPFDYMHWSQANSPTNSGYIKISFPISTLPTKAILHITDGVDIDITNMIPTTKGNNPWISATKPFMFDGVQLKINSVHVVDNFYRASDNSLVEKKNSKDRFLVIKFVSPTKDLSVFEKILPFVLVDGTNIGYQYDIAHMEWTTELSKGDGTLTFVYEIPKDTSSYFIYIPYETLIDLTPLFK